MKPLNAVYRQFHQPSGPLGRVAGWIMANRPSNVERNRWTVDRLELSETDCVLEIGFGPVLPRFGPIFDKVFSVNVLHLHQERDATLRSIRAVLKPGGLLATTVQPRHRGATAGDARAFAALLSKEMAAAGYHDIRTEELPLDPVPAVCVLGRR